MQVSQTAIGKGPAANFFQALRLGVSAPACSNGTPHCGLTLVADVLDHRMGGAIVHRVATGFVPLDRYLPWMREANHEDEAENETPGQEVGPSKMFFKKFGRLGFRV